MLQIGGECLFNIPENNPESSSSNSDPTALVSTIQKVEEIQHTFSERLNADLRCILVYAPAFGFRGHAIPELCQDELAHDFVKKYQFGLARIAKIAGYIPIIGVIIGISRIRLIDPNLSTPRQSDLILRGVFEIYSILGFGIFLFLIDIGMTETAHGFENWTKENINRAFQDLQKLDPDLIKKISSSIDSKRLSLFSDKQLIFLTPYISKQQIMDFFLKTMDHDRLKHIIEHSKSPQFHVMVAEGLNSTGLFVDLKTNLLSKFAANFDHYDLKDNILLLEQMMEAHPDWIKQQGGIAQLSEDKKKYFLPWCLPSEIITLIDNLSSSEREGFLKDSPKNLLEKELNNLNPHYKEGYEISLKLIAEDTINKLSICSFALLTKKNPQLIVPFLSVLDNSYFTAAIPFIPKEMLFDAISTLDMPLQCEIIKSATLDTKKYLLEKLEFKHPNLEKIDSTSVDFNKALHLKSILNIHKSNLQLYNIAFRKGENDDKFKDDVLMKIQDVSYGELEETCAEIIRKEEEKIPSEFLDFFTCEIMVNPIRVGSFHIDISSLEKTPENFLKDFSNVTCEVDEDLKARINDWKKNNPDS